MNMHYTLPLRTTAFAMATGLMLGASPAIAAVAGNGNSTALGQYSSMSSGTMNGGGMAGMQLSQNTDTGTGTNGTTGTTGTGNAMGTAAARGAATGTNAANGGAVTTGTTGYGGAYGGYGHGGGGGLWGLIGLVGLFGLAGGVRRRP